MARAVRWLILSSAIFVAGCRRPSAKPEATTDAAPTAATASGASVVADGGAKVAAVAMADASSSTVTEPPLASGDFELVALGKSEKSSIIWLRVLGSRVWLSGKGTDAYADGAGDLALGADLLKGVPYEWGKQRVEVHGRWPNVVALRTNVVTTRADPDRLTAFVHGTGGWKPASPLKNTDFPHAVATWADGILLVHSQIARNAYASYDPEAPGSTFEHVAWDGTVSVPPITIDRSFMAWDADSDGKTLSLLGTLGRTPRKRDDIEPEKNISVARGTLAVGSDAGPGARAVTLVTTEIQNGLRISLESYRAHVHETGAFAFVTPPSSLTASATEAWKPSPQTLWFLDQDRPRTRKPAFGTTCTVDETVMVGGATPALYALVACYDGANGANGARIVRVGADEKIERLGLPGLVRERGVLRLAKPKEKVGLRCEPTHLILREAEDLWASASCFGDEEDGGSITIPAVFRRGRPQTLVRF